MSDIYWLRKIESLLQWDRLYRSDLLKGIDLKQAYKDLLRTRGVVENSRENNVEAVAVLLAYGFDSATDNEHAMVDSSRSGYTKIVSLLLRDGRANPSVENNLPLVLAVKNWHRDTIELLIQDTRVDPQARDNYALKEALRRGDRKVASLVEKAVRLRIPKAVAIEAPKRLD